MKNKPLEMSLWLHPSLKKWISVFFTDCTPFHGYFLENENIRLDFLTLIIFPRAGNLRQRKRIFCLMYENFHNCDLNLQIKSFIVDSLSCKIVHYKLLTLQKSGRSLQVKVKTCKVKISICQKYSIVQFKLVNKMSIMKIRNKISQAQ